MGTTLNASETLLGPDFSSSFFSGSHSVALNLSSKSHKMRRGIQMTSFLHLYSFLKKTSFDELT